MSKKDKTSQKQPKKRRFAPLAWMIAREISGYNDVLSIGDNISSIHYANTHIPKKENAEQKKLRRKSNRAKVWKIVMKSCGLAISLIQVGKVLKIMKVSKGMVAALTTLRVVKRADKIKKEIEQGDVIGTASAVLGAVSSVADSPIVKGVSKAATVAENIKDIGSSDERSGTIKVAKVAQDVYEIATGEKVSDGIKKTIKNIEKVNSAYTKADKELSREEEKIEKKEKEKGSSEEIIQEEVSPQKEISKMREELKRRKRYRHPFKRIQHNVEQEGRRISKRSGLKLDIAKVRQNIK